MSWRELWLTALVEQVGMDVGRLDRGAGPALAGQVGEIEIEPGVIRATVHGATPHTAVIGVATLTRIDLGRFVDRALETATAAALLGADVPEELAEHLLPGRRTISCDCSCADGLEPCRHAAAVLHAFANRLEIEPFALLLLRGIDREYLLSELRATRARTIGFDDDPATSDLPRGVDPGTGAAAAWRRDPEPVQASIRSPRKPGAMVNLAAPPPSDSGIDERELRALVDDAATRAFAMLAGSGDSGLALGPGADVVRRAVDGDLDAISAETKVPLDELTGAAHAWRLGGQDGLRASRRRWDADPADLQPAVDALGTGARMRANTVSLNQRQLRLDEDGRWWLFHTDDELGWVLAADHAEHPADLL